jgi:hypothetical protein
MTHPEDLLAGYVDGSLTEDERAAVDAHLETCETCREEVDLATRAVTVLADLPDEPVPFGVTNPVTAELGRRTARARPVWSRPRLQWVAGLTAAAAVAASLAVILPRLGRGPAVNNAAEGGVSATLRSPGALRLSAVVPLERQHIDYADPSKLRALAEQSAGREGSKYLSQAPAADDALIQTAEAARSCVATAADGGLTANDILVRLIQAKFEGKPAYLGVYLERPGAHRKPDQVVIWVASKDGCGLLSFSSKAI